MATISSPAGNGLDQLHGNGGTDTVVYNIDDGDKSEAVEVDLAAGIAHYLNTDGSHAGVSKITSIPSKTPSAATAMTY